MSPSRAWRTPRGMLVESDDRFFLLAEDGAAIASVFEPGSYSSEDDLIRWRWEVVGTELIKHQLVESRGTETASSRVEIDDLRAPSEAEGNAALAGLAGLVASREARLRAEAEARRAAKIARETSFLAALPDQAATLAFRRDGLRWVVTDGTTEVWSIGDYRWRGKDLHFELARLLRDKRADVVLKLDLDGDEDWMCYGDD